MKTLTNLRKKVETGVDPRLGSWLYLVHYNQVDKIEINSTWLLCTLIIFLEVTNCVENYFHLLLSLQLLQMILV